MSDTWVPEENTKGPLRSSPTVRSAPDQPWVEEVQPTWGQAIGQGADDFLRRAASAIPLYDRIRAIPDIVSGTPYSEAVNKQAEATDAASQRLGPFMSSTADIAGGAGMGYGLVKGGLSTIGRGIADATQPLWKRLFVSGAEAGLHGAIQGASHTYSENLPDYVKNATVGGAFGAALGAGLPAVGAGAQALYKNVSDRFSGIPAPVLKAGAVDAQGLGQLGKLGPDAMLADAGPSMLATAQGAAQGVGENRSLLIQAVQDRNKGTVPRLQADLNTALGPAPRVSQIEGGIDNARKAINANDYAPVLQGTAMHPQSADTVMAALDALGKSSRIPMDDVRNALILPGTRNLPDLSPQTWLQARQNIDSMITVANRAGDRYRVGVLQQARDMVDNELAANVPGIKMADAKFANNRAELEGLNTGQTLLDKGKNATHPDDLRDLMTVAPPMVNIRLRQGAHADLERRLGTEANDLSQLKRTVGTPEDWNSQKITDLFGPQAKRRLDTAVDRETVFKKTHDEVAGGPNTAQKIAAGEDMNIKPITNITSGGLWSDVKKVAVGAVNKVREASAEQQRDAIARVMALRDPAEVARLRDAILQQNVTTATRGPLVNQATRGIVQGGVNAALPPLYINPEDQ
jgi:hypothetical protein